MVTPWRALIREISAYQKHSHRPAVRHIARLSSHLSAVQLTEFLQTVRLQAGLERKAAIHAARCVHSGLSDKKPYDRAPTKVAHQMQAFDMYTSRVLDSLIIDFANQYIQQSSSNGEHPSS
jgi:hypothetical protein